MLGNAVLPREAEGPGSAAWYRAHASGQRGTQPQGLERQRRKSTTIPVLLANPRFWPSKASSFCDVGIWVGSYCDVWKTPIPNEKHKGLHGRIVGIGLGQGCPSLENLA